MSTMKEKCYTVKSLKASSTLEGIETHLNVSSQI
jgi:hypothetical protein